MANLPDEIARYHLDRCIKSGLWVPDANKAAANADAESGSGAGGEGESKQEEEEEETYEEVQWSNRRLELSFSSSFPSPINSSMLFFERRDGEVGVDGSSWSWSKWLAGWLRYDRSSLASCSRSPFHPPSPYRKSLCLCLVSRLIQCLSDFIMFLTICLSI